MIQLTFDPDYTAVAVPRLPGAPTPFWVLTREQWYVVARIVYREHIRAHVKWHFSETDPDYSERKQIADRVGALLQRMRDDRLQVFSRVEWGTRIAWWNIACFAYWYASQRDNGWALLQSMDSADSNWVRSYWDWLNAYGCPNEVLSDYSYASGLAAHGASLDPIQAYSDPANEQTYEQQVDAIWWNIFQSHSLSSSQSITLGGAPSAGAGYTKQKPEPSPGDKTGAPTSAGYWQLFPTWVSVAGASAVVASAIAGAAAIARKLLSRT